MPKVLRVNNAAVRNHIENFTQQYTFPDVIKFVQDGAGNWVTSIENLENLRYKGIRSDIKEYLQAQGINNNFRSLREVLENYGVEIDYIPEP